VPLGQIAEVRFGVKTGCDSFFFPKDVTQEKLAENITDWEFKERYGIRKKETDKIRIVHAGDGSQHLIEAEYIEPEVHGPMEIDSISLEPGRLARQILLVDLPKEKLQGTHVLKYIKYGEKERIHERSTCASRPLWYSLPILRRGNSFWPMATQYRHIIPLNSQKFICNHNLFDIFAAQGIQDDLLVAVLNSTITVLFKHQFGRIMGREGNLKTEVIDVKMMLVADPRKATVQLRDKLVSALNSMRNRKAVTIVDVDSDENERWTGELAMADRQMLDDAVLELIGIKDQGERNLILEELYREITKMYRQIRVAEKKMQKFRTQTARKGKQTAQSVAEEIWTDLGLRFETLTPLDFVFDIETDTIELPPGRAKLVEKTFFQEDGIQIGDHHLELGSLERARFVKAVSDVGLHGEIEIPTLPDEAEKALKRYQMEYEKLDDLFTKEAATFTADENLQERIVKELWKKLRKH
jgi:hypothetical protein